MDILRDPVWQFVGVTIVSVLTFIIIVYSFRQTSRNIPTLDKAVDEIAKAKTADVQQIAASQLELNNSFYKIVLQQSKQSFIIAIVFAAAGLIFFFFVSRDPGNPSAVSLVGGGLTEFLSAINFYLYGRAAVQLQTFHSRLDKLQFFVLANSICENLTDELKYTTRAELVLAVADVLTVNSDENSSHRRRNKQLLELIAKQTKPEENKVTTK